MGDGRRGIIISTAKGSDEALSDASCIQTLGRRFPCSPTCTYSRADPFPTPTNSTRFAVHVVSPRTPGHPGASRSGELSPRRTASEPPLPETKTSEFHSPADGHSTTDGRRRTPHPTISVQGRPKRDPGTTPCIFVNCKGALLTDEGASPSPGRQSHLSRAKRDNGHLNSRYIHI